MPQGHSELEFYHTVSRKDVNTWEYFIEVEHGITNKFDIALYQIFINKEGGALSWEAVKIRGRYRFGEKDKYFVNPLIYIEYKWPLVPGKSDKLEFKLIVDKNIKSLNIAVNPIYELIFQPGISHEFGVDIAASYRFLKEKLGIGIEISNRTEIVENKLEAQDYIGPTLSYKAGTFYAAAGIQYGITRYASPLRGRSIIGIFF